VRSVVTEEDGTLVELCGEQTEIHHNGGDGHSAYSNPAINIYIPSRSITALVHDNEERDLCTRSTVAKFNHNSTKV